MKQAITWIKKVLDFDKELYCSCLQPDPPMFARVGHPWSMLTSIVRKNLEILQRLVSLNEHKLIPELVSKVSVELFIMFTFHHMSDGIEYTSTL